MKVVVLLGSPRKKDSYRICKMIEEQFMQKEEVAFEYVQLSEMDIKECRGCEVCLTKGETCCPIKDELPLLKQKLCEADGIIFSSPVYACQITGSLKKTIDRLAYLFHRPELVGKPALSVVTTGGGGIADTRKYLKMTAVGWGCWWIGSIDIIASRFFKERLKWKNIFYNPQYEAKMKVQINKKAEAFYKAIKDKNLPSPTFYDIYMFNGLRGKTLISKVDYDFWKEKGWLQADYYYQTHMGVIKRIWGKLINQLVKSIIAKVKNNQEQQSDS